MDSRMAKHNPSYLKEASAGGIKASIEPKNQTVCVAAKDRADNFNPFLKILVLRRFHKCQRAGIIAADQSLQGGIPFSRSRIILHAWIFLVSWGKGKYPRKRGPFSNAVG